MSEIVPRTSPWRRRMVPRRTDEPHRASTVLELFFDLIFVVAVAQAAGALEESLRDGHFGTGAIHYGLVFFAIWWAWMNFTWFASAYDVDDGPYRLLTLVQAAGALVMAAGIGQAATHGDYRLVVIGYVIMRLALVTQWLRAAAADPGRRDTAITYAVGVSVVQIGWVAWLWVPSGAQIPIFLLLAAAELAVPALAERRRRTPWHPEHITERYGLFTIIVLGESIAAVSTSVHEGIGNAATGAQLYLVAGSGLLVVFGMWWLYFDQPSGHRLDRPWKALSWGYSHLLVFASAAAVGAGLQVNVALDMGESELSDLAASEVVGVPVAIYLVMVWLLQIRPLRCASLTVAYGVAIVATLVTPLWIEPGVAAIAGVVVVLVGAVAVINHIEARRTDSQ